MVCHRAWINFLKAYVSKTEPTYGEIGFAYMLQGDTPVSNRDPFATESTGPEDWVTNLGPHLMMVVPNREVLKAISTDHLNRGTVGHVAGHAVRAHHDPPGESGTIGPVTTGRGGVRMCRGGVLGSAPPPPAVYSSLGARRIGGVH